MVLRTKTNLFLLLLSCSIPLTGLAQTQAFKRDRPKVKTPLVLPSMIDYQLLESFALVQEANSGRPAAQHELGVRYLVGKGFQADTAKAFLWIQKAADQGLPIAQFNLGILHMNGFGTSWNPYAAFKNYRLAAEGGISEALYMLGVAYSEDLIVPKNWPVSYGYFCQAADRGYAPAQRAADEIRRRGLDKVSAPQEKTPGSRTSKNANSSRSSSDTSFSLLFVEFSSDTSTTVSDTTLIREAARSIERNADESDEREATIDSTFLRRVVEAADFSNPEARCILGRLMERGTGMPRDPLGAAEQYIRAVRVESFRAANLLWSLARTDEFRSVLKQKTDARDPVASFIWAGLTSLKFSDILAPDQVVRLLETAASRGHEASMIEIGLCAMTGRWMIQDRGRAVTEWSRAANMGSREARIRLAITAVLGEHDAENIAPAIAMLDSGAARGSIIAESALAYCAEQGIGVRQDAGEAYRAYHRMMIRGSESSFLSLKRMHEERRPNDEEFLRGQH